MIRLFCGFDAREEPGLHVFVSSVLHRASKPILFSPLTSLGLTQGSNEFTLSRFLVAKLCEFKGRAIFLDGADMLVLDDITKLDALYDPRYAVQVVKHPAYISRHRRKYVGTAMECEQSNYARKNWASAMLINCEHEAWQDAHRMIGAGSALKLLQFSFLADEQIGELPREWNVLVDEGQDPLGAKVLHWTAGIPHFTYYANAERADMWFSASHDVRHGRMS